jgi:Rgp1
MSPSISPFPSPLAQVNKLDLHSTVEDDASSDTSSVGPSKPKLPSLDVFNSFSPRSSLDIRDMDPNRLLPSQSRRLPRSPLGPSQDGTPMNSLMMGYAQIVGHFMIDPALIDASEFDEVKKKGVVGGNSGGGVVGVDARRTNSWTGLGSIGTFGLSSIFGASQPSSLTEMHDRAGTSHLTDLPKVPKQSQFFQHHPPFYLLTSACCLANQNPIRIQCNSLEIYLHRTVVVHYEYHTLWLSQHNDRDHQANISLQPKYRSDYSPTSMVSPSSHF